MVSKMTSEIDDIDEDEFFYGSEQPAVKRLKTDVSAALENEEKPSQIFEMAPQPSREESEGESDSDSESDIEFVLVPRRFQAEGSASKIDEFHGKAPAPAAAGDRQTTAEEIKSAPIEPTPSEISKVEIKTPSVSGAPETHKSLDIDAVAEYNGKPITQIPLEEFVDKPWRNPGADLTNYFNYGFDEFTWTAYCSKQDQLRANFTPQKVMGIMGMGPMFMPGMPGMPPGMPPMPLPGMMPMGLPPIPNTASMATNRKKR